MVKGYMNVSPQYDSNQTYVTVLEFCDYMEGKGLPRPELQQEGVHWSDKLTGSLVLRYVDASNELSALLDPNQSVSKRRARVSMLLKWQSLGGTVPDRWPTKLWLSVMESTLQVALEEYYGKQRDDETKDMPTQGLC